MNHPASPVVIRPALHVVVLWITINFFLGAGAIWTAIASGSFSPASASIGALGIGLVLVGALIFRVEAGCDDGEIWSRLALGRRSVSRSAVASYTVTSWRGFDSLQFYDAAGGAILNIPADFFARKDVDRLLMPLKVPRNS